MNMPRPDTKPVMERLEQKVKDIPGWSPLDQLFVLHELILLNPELPGAVVEVGTWCGRSAVAMGLAAESVGAQVHCIDIFPNRSDWVENEDGTFSVQVKLGAVAVDAYTGQRVWREPFQRDIEPLYREHPDLQAYAAENIRMAGLESTVSLHRGTAGTFVEALPEGFQIRLLFLDGDHGYEAVCQDIQAFYPFLVPGAWICFDDAHSCYEGVDRAIRELVIESGRFELCHQPTRKCFVARKRKG